MATTYNSGEVRLLISSTMSNALDLSTTQDVLSKSYTTTYTNGTGANQAQAHWHDSRSLLTTTDETLDLTALAGQAFGTLAGAKLREIIIANNTTTAGYRLEVGAAGANAFTAFVKDASDVVIVPAGAQFRIPSPVDGFTIDATHKLLKISNPSGGTVNYDIILIATGTVS